MMIAALYLTSLLVLTTIFPQVSLEVSKSDEYDYESLTGGVPEEIPYGVNDEYIRRIHSMIDAHRSKNNDRMIIETNALINTKYRTWKRNADLINSLLALPKGMNDAGRR